jgi:hypothetical protein
VLEDQLQCVDIALAGCIAEAPRSALGIEFRLPLYKELGDRALLMVDGILQRRVAPTILRVLVGALIKE